LYLQVRKIVYPKASEGSLREDEEAWVKKMKY
jgi:hypothetical protein